MLRVSTSFAYSLKKPRYKISLRLGICNFGNAEKRRFEGVFCCVGERKENLTNSSHMVSCRLQF